jgi:hypothetical protein
MISAAGVGALITQAVGKICAETFSFVKLITTLLVGGRDFSVVYNTWRGFFFLYTIIISIVFFE